MVEGPRIDQSDHALKGCDAVLDHARPVRVQHVGARCHRLRKIHSSPVYSSTLELSSFFMISLPRFGSSILMKDTRKSTTESTRVHASGMI